MAKIQGITGGLSGKMGSAVFRQSGGQTVVTQYQPIVKNPNSNGQKSQRAKFKLMSQLSAIMSSGFGSFIIKTRPEKGKGTQRNAFVQTNFPLVTTTETTEGVRAEIPMEQLKLTTSFRPLPTPVLTAAQEGIEVSIPKIATEVKSVRFITVGYTGNVAGIVDIRDIPVQNGRAAGIIDVTTRGDFTVLAYGLIPSESTAVRASLDNIHTPSDEDFISAIQLDAMVANGEMAETMTVGANITLT